MESRIFPPHIPESEFDICQRFVNLSCFIDDESHLSPLPFPPRLQVVKFAVASGDKKLKIIHSDLDDVNRCTFLEGHTDYINDVVFLENGHQVRFVYQCWSSFMALVCRRLCTDLPDGSCLCSAYPCLSPLPHLFPLT